MFNFDRPPTGDEHICDNIVHFNEDMITVSPVTTSVAVFLILASNGLMIAIANVDKNPYVISLCDHTKLIRYLYHKRYHIYLNEALCVLHAPVCL
jgi:hypothetical protein